MWGAKGTLDNPWPLREDAVQTVHIITLPVGSTFSAAPGDSVQHTLTRAGLKQLHAQIALELYGPETTREEPFQDPL